MLLDPLTCLQGKNEEEHAHLVEVVTLVRENVPVVEASAIPQLVGFGVGLRVRPRLYIPGQQPLGLAWGRGHPALRLYASWPLRGAVGLKVEQ